MPAMLGSQEMPRGLAAGWPATGWPRDWFIAVLIAFGFAWVAAFRVARVPPLLLGMGSFVSFALPVVVALLVGLAAGAILGLLLDGVSRAIDAARRARSGPTAIAATEDERAATQRAFITAALLLGGTWAAFKWLAIPLALPVPASPADPGGIAADIAIPLVGASAARYLWPLTIGFVAVVGYAGWRWVAPRARQLALVRAILNLYWMGLLAAMLLGPNVFKGDLLEWAARIDRSSLSSGWLETATSVVSGLWPAARVLLLVVLVRVGIQLALDARTAWGVFATRGKARRPETG
jgi:hypothetical protein